jgi:O-antigen ligase
LSVSAVAFVLTFVVLLFLALTRHARFGVYAYLLAFYVHPPSRWWGQSLPDMRWSLLASFVTVIAIAKHGGNDKQPSWLSTTPARAMIVLAAWVWMQNFWALDGAENLSLSVLYLKYLVLYYFVYRTSDSTKAIGWFLLAHVVGSLYLGFLAYGSQVSGRLDGVGGPGIDDSNTLAMHLATAAVCGSMLALVHRNWKLYLCGLSLAFILNAVVLCASRGAFLSIVAAGFVLAAMKPKVYSRLFYAYAILGIALFLFVASASFWQRMGTLQAAVDDRQQMDTSAESRIVMVMAQIRMAAVYPFGTGHRGTAVLSRSYLEERYMETLADGTKGQRSSHNTFLSALVEHGIPGAAIFVWLVAWCRAAARRIHSQSEKLSPELNAYTAAVTASLVVVLVAGIFFDCIAIEVQFWMLAVLASIDAVIRTHGKFPDESSPG